MITVDAGVTTSDYSIAKQWHSSFENVLELLHDVTPETLFSNCTRVSSPIPESSADSFFLSTVWSMMGAPCFDFCK